MPKGQYQRIRKAPAGAHVAITTDPIFANITDLIGEEELATGEPALPRGWAKGAHLNVRNVGTEYRITLFPEEFNPAQPERCLRFTSPVECQNFVSAWYQRESHDPRAR